MSLPVASVCDTRKDWKVFVPRGYLIFMNRLNGKASMSLFIFNYHIKHSSRKIQDRRPPKA